MSIEVLTFGCRLNTYESEAMRELAGKAGEQDVLVVNTCAVTAEAERQARPAIRRAARERPDLRIIVTGCAAQIAPAAWGALPGVARVIGNADKLKPEAWGAGAALPVTAATYSNAINMPMSSSPPAHSAPLIKSSGSPGRKNSASSAVSKNTIRNSSR